jgi:hypothetical protein
MTEKLKPTESAHENQAIEIKHNETSLTPESAQQMFEQRLAQTEAMHPFISLKFFYQVKEKVIREQGMARKLLKIEEDRQEKLDQFSFVLNPSYFEQKLIS